MLQAHVRNCPARERPAWDAARRWIMDHRNRRSRQDLHAGAPAPASGSTRLPAHLAPKNFADSCAIMDAVDKLVGERIVGTKIAAKPGAEVVYAPLAAGRVFTSPARVPRALTPCQYMECEISFRLTRDLPAARESLHRGRSVRRAGRLRRVRTGRQPLPRSESGDGKDAVRVLRRPHRQRRDGVRPVPQGLAELRLHQDARHDEAGIEDHRRQGRRASDRQSGEACGGSRQPAARLNRAQGRHVRRHRLVHRLSSGRADRGQGEFEGFDTMEATIRHTAFRKATHAKCERRSSGSLRRSDAPWTGQSTFSFGYTPQSRVCWTKPSKPRPAR